MDLVQHLRDWMTRRRLTAGLLFVTSLLMLFPISIQMAAPDAGQESSGKDQSAPFPCQSRLCGCKSAQQCWKKCCCFTDTQKVAWAKANRVTPPVFVVIAAKREAPVAKATGRRTVVCCSTREVKSTHPVNRPRVRLVVGIEALQCQGVEQTIAGQLISLQPPVAIHVVWGNLETGEVAPLRGLRLTPSEQEPPTPPPRIVDV